ncbi:MAG: discoidin domain-containing protein [Pseudomonadota bacterium]|nr:discoidin domain-containing protein [Pseudomonadota bacterium]
MLFGLVATLLSAGLIASADAAVVKPTTWAASSSAPGSDGVSYDIANVADARQSSPWVEGDEGSGLGSWVLADFGGEKTLTGFTVWAGVWYTQEYWNRYNRPKLLVVEFSDGTSQEVTLTDEFKPQAITFASPKKTSSIKLKVKGIYAGNTFNDTGISEVVFHDAAAASHLPVKAYKTSSTFPADGDGNYEPVNTADGILDSMWCEGNKTGDGLSEWFELDLGGSQSVSKLVLRNGNAYSFGYFMKSNRATSASLTFSDGSSEAVTLKDSISEQTITFAPHTTSKVRVTFTGVKKGSEFNDLCISEAYVLP